MNRIAIVFAMGLMAVPLSAAADDDPFAQARAGMVECFKPDTAHKTCEEIDTYSFDAQGGVSNRQEVMLAPKPLVVATATSIVKAHDGAICGTLDKQDFDNAAITVDGKPAPDDVAAGVRGVMRDSVAADLGKEFCVALTPRGDGFATRVTIGGVEKSDSSTVIWVKPGDGYTLAP